MKSSFIYLVLFFTFINVTLSQNIRISPKAHFNIIPDVNNSSDSVSLIYLRKKLKRK